MGPQKKRSAALRMFYRVALSRRGKWICGAYGDFSSSFARLSADSLARLEALGAYFLRDTLLVSPLSILFAVVNFAAKLKSTATTTTMTTTTDQQAVIDSGGISRDLKFAANLSGARFNYVI